MKGTRPSPRDAIALRRQLAWVAAIAMLGAVTISVLLFWEARTRSPPAQSVRVYRTHGCKCVFPWIRDLQSHGFAVQVAEPESLRPIRAALHTPKELRGCHVGVFMGYFVEGHVPVEALRRLAQERPAGRGVALKADPTGHAIVLLFDEPGAPTQWHAGDDLSQVEHVRSDVGPASREGE